MLDEFKSALSLFVLIPLVAFVGIVFTIKFRFVQCTHALKAWKFFLKDRDTSDNRSSSFSAVAAVLGGNLGTGNISGIAVALTMGGPGSIFWMWVMATFGSILKFVGCALGVLYRKKGESGQFVGGPMYYLSKGLGMKRAGKFYCVLAILGALTVGNMVQMNSLALPFTQVGVPPLLTGIGMCLLVAAVILGGFQRFSTVSSLLVPFMAVGYVAACSVILILNFEKIIPALELIMHAAFNPTAVVGGIAGFTVLEGLRTGFDRGLFATDTGVGIDAIIHASVDSKTSLSQTALTQGLISTVSPLVVMLVCTLTGLVLIITDSWLVHGLESTNLCIEGFKRGFGFEYAGHIITVTLFFFAFTTILTWSYCADKAVEFLFGAKRIRAFQYLFVACIPLGALVHVKFVWTLADVFMNLMLVLNVVALVGLYKEVALLFNAPERKQFFLQSN